MVSKLIILLLFPFMLSAQVVSKEYKLRKARCMIAATTIPALVSGGLGMWMLASDVKDPVAKVIPLVNMTFFFGASVKAFNNKNKIKRN